MYSRGKYHQLFCIVKCIVGVFLYPLYTHLIGSIYIGTIIPIPLYIRSIPIVIFDSKDNFNYRSNPIAKFGYKDTHIRKYTLW